MERFVRAVAGQPRITHRVPGTGTATSYILRGIIPGWEDDQPVASLTNCLRTMAPRRLRPVLPRDYVVKVPDFAQERK